MIIRGHEREYDNHDQDKCSKIKKRILNHEDGDDSRNYGTFDIKNTKLVRELEHIYVDMMCY